MCGSYQSQLNSRNLHLEIDIYAVKNLKGNTKYKEKISREMKNLRVSTILSVALIFDLANTLKLLCRYERLAGLEVSFSLSTATSSLNLPLALDKQPMSSENKFCEEKKRLLVPL